MLYLYLSNILLSIVCYFLLNKYCLKYYIKYMCDFQRKKKLANNQYVMTYSDFVQK